MIRTLLFIALFGAGAVSAQDAPYVNAAVADSEFHKISADDMDVIRSLKILFGSRSFGYNLRGGLTSLESSDAMYEIINDDYVNYDVFNNGGNVDIVDADAFDRYNFVHFMCTASPWSRRNYELDELMRDWPHTFIDDINVAMLYYHGGDVGGFNAYSAVFDSLRNQYPHITFIYVTGGFEAEEQLAHNTSAAEFSALVRARYQGRVPLYDLGRILNDDGRCGDHYCAEYSTDPAGVHPNTDYIQRRMGQGFLVMLYKLFCEDAGSCTELPAAPPTGLGGTGMTLHGIRLTWDPVATCYDRYLVMRDGSVVGGSFGPGFNDVGLAENTEYGYRIAVRNDAGGATDYCTEVRVRTLNDSVAPDIAEIPVTLLPTSVSVRFDEDVDSVSAVTAGHYAVDGGVSVLGAQLVESDEVLLTTTTLTEDIVYTLTVTGVTDLSVNANAAAGAQGTFRYSPVTVADDYLSYWTFDGTVADSGPGGNDGFWQGGDAAYGALAVAGTGLDLDGTDSGAYVLVSDDASLDAQPEMSVCVWAKKRSADTGGRLYHKHVAYNMDVSASGVSGYVFNIGGVRGNFSVSGADINDTDWHHYAFTHDGDTVRIWIDGVQVGTEPLEDSVANASAGLYIGKNPWGNTFNGYLDEMRIYHWALSQAEINELISGAAANRDSLAVRALLDANGDSRSVDGAATFNVEGRITELLLQADVGGSISAITAHIGQLTELEVLHAYGPQNHDHASPYLVSVDPAIGNCAKLKTLLLNDNDLEDLPPAITVLESLTVFSVGNNLLCGVSDSLRGWLDTYDPDWETTQACSSDTGDTSGITDRSTASGEPFVLTFADGMMKVSFAEGVGRARAAVYGMDGLVRYSVQGVRDGVLECPLNALGRGMRVVKITVDGLDYWQKIITVR